MPFTVEERDTSRTIRSELSSSSPATNTSLCDSFSSGSSSTPIITYLAGEHTLFIDATTNDPLYHVGAFYQFGLTFQEV